MGVMTSIAGAATALPASVTAEKLASAEITPALLQAYSQWLFYERRLLALEMYPHAGIDAERFVPVNTAAQLFHFPLGRDWRDAPKPSSRAALVLSAMGIEWTADEDPLPCSHGAFGTAAEEPHPDAELIRLGRQLDPLMAELIDIWPEYRRASNALERLRARHKAEWLSLYAAGRNEEAGAMARHWEEETGFTPVNARVERLDHELEPIINAIMAHPAATIAGLGVKARAAVWGVLTMRNDPGEVPDGWGEEITRSLILAVMALAGGETLRI